MKSRYVKLGLVLVLAVTLIGGLTVLGLRTFATPGRTNVTAYFENSNGMYEGDKVLILGVPVGKIEKIEPQPMGVKVSFWYDSKYNVPADAKAVILSPKLVTARSIQLTPAYTGGPVMRDGAVIPRDRTAVPVEWGDVLEQLKALTEVLQPTDPGGVSTLGGAVSTLADNVRGQGADIRDSVIKLSQALSALGDHSDDLFGSVKSLAALVSALRDSSGVLKDLNHNLASVTSLLANDPNEVESAVRDLNDVVEDVRAFVTENREAVGTTSDRLASVSQALNELVPELKQLLHVGPTTFQNFLNIYQPAQAALTGIVALANFDDPIQFICGAVQAASQMGAEESAKLCVQYLAPIVKNRRWNFPPIGVNPFVGTMARPNEITYSEDWMRPDYIPPPSQAPPETSGSPLAAASDPPLAAEALAEAQVGEIRETVATNPAEGLHGMMVPSGGGQ